MTSAVTVRHNFETAHRLPHLEGKCVSLHGHSWWVEVTVQALALSATGTVVEFGPFKQRLRNWIDASLDHGVMLGCTDPLCGPLATYGCKVYQFGKPGTPGPNDWARGLEWPTVENVAALLARVASGVLVTLDHADGATVTHVQVTETHVNAATWTAP